MRTVKMSLVSYKGEVINRWCVPYARYKTALDHAMERVRREGHAGVLWTEVRNGKTKHMNFESYDMNAIAKVASILEPYTEETKLFVGK